MLNPCSVWSNGQWPIITISLPLHTHGQISRNIWADMADMTGSGGTHCQTWQTWPALKEHRGRQGTHGKLWRNTWTGMEKLASSVAFLWVSLASLGISWGWKLYYKSFFFYFVFTNKKYLVKNLQKLSGRFDWYKIQIYVFSNLFIFLINLFKSHIGGHM